MSENNKSLNRRKFIKTFCKAGLGVSLVPIVSGFNSVSAQTSELKKYNPYEHHFGMGIDVKTCIGCGRCAVACEKENNVPPEPIYTRTWIERYTKLTNGRTIVESLMGRREGFQNNVKENMILRSFFVPKLCNHCKNAPCVQVCPVGATFRTVEGVILVDKDYCIGCSYCIQACPYGARFMNPITHTADKCSFCYHRLDRGLKPACVEVCPTRARIFGDTVLRSSQLNRFFRFNEIQVLKPDLNTEPQVFYASLDGVVR